MGRYGTYCIKNELGIHDDSEIEIERANIRPAQNSGKDSLESNLFPQGIPI